MSCQINVLTWVITGLAGKKSCKKQKKNNLKKKAAEYYTQNKEKSRERCKNLSQVEKYKITEYQRKTYQELVQYKKEALKKIAFCFFFLIQKMSEKTLKFNNVRVNKKEFHKSK